MTTRLLKTLLLTAALLCIPCRMDAHDTVASRHPFVRTGENHLRYDSASASLRHFIHKYQQVTARHQGNISIVHIGGSHVQAGTLPHRIRCNILSTQPRLVGSRGMIFPYSAAAKCNNPSDYRVHCKQKVTLTRNVYRSPEHDLGLCGIAVTAQNDTTTIQMLLTDKSYDYRTSRVVLLGYSPHGVVPLLSYGGRTIYPSYLDKASRRYVFNLISEVDSFDIVIPCTQGRDFTLNGVYLGSQHQGITYSSIGVNGAATCDYLKCRLTSDLRLLHPDLVIFGIGINDAHGTEFDSVTFKENYLKLCDSVRAVNPNCAFIFFTNNDSYRRTGKGRKARYTVNSNGLQVRDVCYRLAAQTGGAVWDQFQIMGGLKSMEHWQKAGLAQRDRVHFTRAGYQLVGDLFSQAFLEMVNTPAPAAAADKPKAKAAPRPAPKARPAKAEHKTSSEHKTFSPDESPADYEPFYNMEPR